MLDQEDKKNGPIDYSKFFEEEREKLKTEEISPHEKKKSFLGSLKFFWTSSDKKTRIQIIVFLAIIFLIIIILTSYIIKLDIGVTQNSFYAPPAE